MTRHRQHLLLAVLCVAGLSLTAADPPTKPPADKPGVGKGEKTEKPKLPTTKEEFKALAESSPHPPWLPYMGNIEVGDRSVHGTVVKTTDDSITIRPKGETVDVTFNAHVLLATGAVCHWESDNRCYLLPDVQKGDVVRLGVGEVVKDAADECFYIVLRKRPGGKIPPSRKPEGAEPWHVRQQQVMDEEEKAAKEGPKKQPDDPTKK